MNKQWWKEVIVYQVYWRSFKDTNGDGIGDLKGVLEKLDYIQSLGIDVIWLNPFYESPDKDYGYDISDYMSIMEKAGDMKTFEHLLSEVHRRGMKLMMDLVVNHTSNQHPWFLESSSSKDNPKRDWYIWKDGKEGNPPNNWRSYFEPSTWTYDGKTGQYYFHSFTSEQPDLNWENPEVREAVYDMMRFWLDKGIDGFRMDVINLLAKVKGFPDVENPYIISHLGNNPGVHELLQEMNEKVLKHYDIMTVGEIPFVTPKDGLLYVGEDRNELNTLFHFEILDDMTTMDVRRFKDIQNRWAKGLYGKGTNSQFLNNHDHTRMVTRFGNDKEYHLESAKMLGTLTHTLPGIPYIFQGEEIGMTGIHLDTIDQYKDIAMKNEYEERVSNGEDPETVLEDLRLLSRDNSRTPMQWNSTKNAGFSDGDPWMIVNQNYKEINVESAWNDENSVLHYYRKLIRLRKEYEVFVYGHYESILDDREDIFIFKREYENQSLLVMCNLTEQDTYFEFEDMLEDYQLVLTNYTIPEKRQGRKLYLRPFESRLFLKII